MGAWQGGVRDRLRDRGVQCEDPAGGTASAQVWHIPRIPSGWKSEDLVIGDIISAMIRFKEEGGCRLRIAVNGVEKWTHDFLDAPPDEAIGFLYPAVRLSGASKSVRLRR